MVVEDNVALDLPINIFVDNKHILTLFGVPQNLEDLAIGYLLGEGIVSTLDEVESVSIENTDISIYLSPEAKPRLEKYGSARLVLSSCGSLEDYFNVLSRGSVPYVLSRHRVCAGRLVEIVRDFIAGRSFPRSELALHTAAIVVSNEFRVYREDVSRHAVIDKVIGGAAREGVDFGEAILVTSGRLSADMVLKASRVGIPIAVSLRGPLFSGIYVALRTGVTVVSVPRGKGATVYTYPERIK